jgi:exopolysaccharide biosynthesis protein
MKQLLLILATAVLSGRGVAQSDSLSLLKADWSSKTLAKGAVWRSVHFTHNDLFGSNEVINVIEISKKGLRGVRLVVAHSDSLEKTSQLASTHDALAGINGSFFKMRGPDPDNHRDLNGVPKLERSLLAVNRSVVYIREHDSVIAENPPQKSPKRQRHAQGSIALSDTGVAILEDDSMDLNWEHHIAGRDVISTGPVMLLSGINQPIGDDAFCRNRHPRTAVGRKADGTVVLLVVDGRAAESAGMSIPELQQTMRWLGCVDAINLDGGGSSTMYVKGEPYAGVVSYPSDNKKWDHVGEREVANVLLLESRSAH